MKILNLKIILVISQKFKLSNQEDFINYLMNFNISLDDLKNLYRK